MLWSCAKGRAPGQTCQLKPLMWSSVEFSKRKFGGSNTLKTLPFQELPKFEMVFSFSEICKLRGSKGKIKQVFQNIGLFEIQIC